MLNPILIIVIGPTGCGKGSLPNKVIKHLDRNQNNLNTNKCVFGLIDNYVEENPFYKKFVDDFIEESYSNGKTNEQIAKSFMKPTDKMLKDFGDAYWKSRNSTNCTTGNILALNNKGEFINPNNKTKICDAVHDKALLEGAKVRKNLVFETTGLSFPFWLMDFLKDNKTNNNSILKDYDIIVTFSTVELSELYARNLKRARDDMSEYLDRKSHKPPRLPNIKPEIFVPLLMQILATFVISTTLGKNWKKTRVLVFDNPTKSLTKRVITTQQTDELIFDSLKDGNNINRKKLNVILKYIPSLPTQPAKSSNKLYNVVKKATGKKTTGKKLTINPTFSYKTIVNSYKLTKNNFQKQLNTIRGSSKKRKPSGKKKVRKIHKGPRGGKYYISKGRKVYI